MFTPFCLFTRENGVYMSPTLLKKSLYICRFPKSILGMWYKGFEFLYETIRLQMLLYFFQLMGFSYPSFQVIVRKNLDNQKFRYCIFQLWNGMPVISVLGKIKQECQEFKANTGFIESLTQNNLPTINLRIKL